MPELKLRPEGRLPLEIVQVNGVVPVAVSVALYELPTSPLERDDVVIDGATTDGVGSSGSSGSSGSTSWLSLIVPLAALRYP